MQTNKQKYTIRICLLVHNRFELAKIALNSLLNQSSTDYVVYVSDNSDELLFSDYVNEVLFEHTNLEYKYRNIKFNGIEHINTVIDESMAYDFIMIFHDDDILHHDYLEKIIKLPEIDDINLAAIAINGLLIKNNLLTNKKVTNYNCNKKIFLKNDLVDSYICYDSNGAPPFPGYLYRTSMIKNVRLRVENGGKHSDLSFLTDILSNGYFLWLNNPLMSYRIHENNDSKIYSKKDRESLYNYLNNNHLLTSKAKTDFKLMINIEEYNNKLIKKSLFYYLLLKYLIIAIFNMRIVSILNAKIRNLKNIKDIFSTRFHVS